MKKFLLAALAALALVPQVAHAQYPVGRVEATLFNTADQTTATQVYFVFADRSGTLSPASGEGATGVFGPGTAVNRPIETVGSSTTVSCDAGEACFMGAAVGDLILITVLEVEYERVITAKASNDSVTVNSAITIAAETNWRHKRLLQGANAGDAWFSVSGFDDFNIQFDWTTKNATSLTTRVQCRVSKFAEPNTLEDYVFSAVGSHSLQVSTRQSECRVGSLITGDTGVNAFKVSFIGAK